MAVERGVGTEDLHLDGACAPKLETCVSRAGAEQPEWVFERRSGLRALAVDLKSRSEAPVETKKGKKGNTIKRKGLQRNGPRRNRRLLNGQR